MKLYLGLMNIIVLGLGIFVTACNDNFSNNKGIHVDVCVVDSVTNKPIPNARISVLCWYHNKWDKTDYVNFDTIADKNGCFRAFFDEGYKVVAAGIALNYSPKLLQSERLVNNGMLRMNIKLQEFRNPIVPIDKFNLRDYIVQNSSN